jgi:3-hydroxy-9,10-secoandrosta-1,3,5(10)-triene-9,17-dione monooxygenase
MRDVEPETVLPVPEPGLTPRELIARARSFRQMLRDQQDEAERLGCYTQEVHDAFLQGGLYRLFQPRRYGGYEFPMETYFKVSVEIGRGDPGSAWCYGLGAHHALLVGAHWPAAGQEEIFTSVDGDFIAPHRAPPGGSIEKVDGGYRVNGRWRYSSGVPYATHFIGGAFLRSDDPEGEPEVVNVTVPKGHYHVEEGSWGNGETLGLESTGSFTVVVTDVVIPEHFVAAAPLLGGASSTPGTELHGNPLYLGRLGGFYHGSLVAPQVGAARAALDEYEHLMRDGPHQGLGLLPGQKKIDNANYQRNFGLALNMTDAAEAILIRAGELYSEYCRLWAEEARPFTVEDDVRLWGQNQQAGRLAFEAVELLWRTSDSSITGRRGQRMQRYYRDVSMYRGHGAAQSDLVAPWSAQLALGLPVELPFGRGRGRAPGSPRAAQ